MDDYKHILLLIYDPWPRIFLRDTDLEPESKSIVSAKTLGGRASEKRKNFSSGAGSLRKVTQGCPM